MDTESKNQIFVAVWIVLAVVSFFIFTRPMNPVVKRRWVVGVNIALPILFLAFLNWMGPGVFSWWLIPIMGFIAYGNIRIMQVCRKCSAVQFQRSASFGPPEFCYKCGERIPFPR